MAYCTTLQITRYSGIGVEVFSESLGVGNSTQDSFDLSKGNVIAGSYALKYASVGTSGNNDFTALTETTDYTINKDAGLILLTSAGVTALGTDTLYVDFVYSPKQSDTVLDTYLEPASDEVDKITDNSWNTSTSAVEYFDGYESGYPQTDKPFGYQIEPIAEYQLKFRGVLTITSVIFLDREGNVERTLDSDEYRIVTDDPKEDSRILITTSIPNGKMNIQITYTHGYTTVPNQVQELTGVIGGKMALLNISGGSYKDASTYSLGRESISIGQIYVNVREALAQMQSRIDQLTIDLGDRFAIA